ncbi:hypothetical protein BCM14_1482 [Jezberella montanilacus]|uniref:Class I SAM-dependent methyltransferase n=1 Tax=Jezberella montanilacus TaxID=323426 RepID=A0A2T0XI74_9BURK|nr:class I SAM-dependent methyltransferase [Jezberella montanilacus]PRY98649.1 hypothetical protein BCM14_1482 [Jezberella montanilacus]
MTLVNPIGWRLLKRLGLTAALGRLTRGSLRFDGAGKRAKTENLQRLVTEHFRAYSDPNHPCCPTLFMALDALNNKSAVIVETGSSAWGTNSTILFDAYCNSFGGHCYSVDIRPDPMLQLRRLVSNRTSLYCDDSVSFLSTLTVPENKIDLLYLDSWDVDWNDPIPSAIHGLNEYLTATRNLQSGSLVLIDDTPVDLDSIRFVQPHAIESFRNFQEKFGFEPGKGSLVKRLIESTGRGTILAHKYQLLIRI